MDSENKVAIINTMLNHFDLLVNDRTGEFRFERFDELVKDEQRELHEALGKANQQVFLAFNNQARTAVPNFIETLKYVTTKLEEE